MMKALELHLRVVAVRRITSKASDDLLGLGPQILYPDLIIHDITFIETILLLCIISIHTNQANSK